MKILTKYQAFDGCLFDSEKQCVERDNLVGSLARIARNLAAVPDGCDFANGSGYIQQSQAAVERYKLALLTLIEVEIKHEWIEETRKGRAHVSYVARLLDDAGPDCLSVAWNRLMRIDQYNREWGQPFYAINPDKGTQKQLN